MPISNPLIIAALTLSPAQPTPGLHQFFSTVENKPFESEFLDWDKTKNRQINLKYLGEHPIAMEIFFSSPEHERIELDSEPSTFQMMCSTIETAEQINQALVRLTLSN